MNKGSRLRASRLLSSSSSSPFMFGFFLALLLSSAFPTIPSVNALAQTEEQPPPSTQTPIPDPAPPVTEAPPPAPEPPSSIIVTITATLTYPSEPGSGDTSSPVDREGPGETVPVPAPVATGTGTEVAERTTVITNTLPGGIPQVITIINGNPVVDGPVTITQIETFTPWTPDPLPENSTTTEIVSPTWYDALNGDVRRCRRHSLLDFTAIGLAISLFLTQLI